MPDWNQYTWKHLDVITTNLLNRNEEQIAELTNNQAQTFRINQNGLVPGPVQNQDEGKFLSTSGWQFANTVQQEAPIETDGEYPILFAKYNVTTDNAYINTVNRTSNIYINPSTNTIYADSFVGSIDASNITGTFDTNTLPVATVNNAGIVKCGNGLTMSNNSINITNPLPTVTSNDGGAFLRVNPQGQWTVDNLGFATSILY